MCDRVKTNFTCCCVNKILTYGNLVCLIKGQGVDLFIGGKKKTLNVFVEIWHYIKTKNKKY